MGMPQSGKQAACEFISKDPEQNHRVAGLNIVGHEAPSTAHWTYKVWDEQRRSFVGYLPHSSGRTNPILLRRFFRCARDDTPWERPVGKFGPLPRKTAWMVSGCCQCGYNYGGTRVLPTAFPNWMYRIMEHFMPFCGLSRESWPNSCNLNLYDHSGESVGWHADDESLFQGGRRDCCII